MKHLIFQLGLLVVLTAQVGCQSLVNRDASLDSNASFWKDWGNKKNKEEEVVFAEPKQMGVLWTSTTMVGQNGKLIRGFGGRFYFNDQKNKPVRVDGELTVYAYDDTLKTEKTSPDRIYKFRSEELQNHFSQSAIGPSYSFWVPWDPVGGERKSIALVPVFKTAAGQVVSGDQSLNVLPGSKSKTAANVPEVPYYVVGSSAAVIAPEAIEANNLRLQANEAQQVAHFAPSAAQSGDKTKTTTIDMPRMMSNRMKILNQFNESSGDFVNSDGLTGSIQYGEAAKPATSDAGTSEAGTSEAGTTQTISDQQPAPPAAKPVYGQPGSFR